jgi:hypothetical protein
VIYSVSYELRRSRTCPAFFSTLSALGARQLVGSLWLVDTSLEARDLLRMLMSCLDRDDAVAVLPLGDPAHSACWNASAPGTAMLAAVERDEPVAASAVGD